MGAYLSRTLREARSGSLKALLKVWLVSHFLFKVAYTLKRMRRTAKALKGIPGPKMDLVMNDFAKNAPRMHDWRKSHLEKNNWAPLIKTANVDGEVMCTSPEAVKTILKTQFHKVTKLSPREDFIWQVLDEFLGTNGIFVMRHGDLLPKENEDWYAQRKTASKIFTKSNFSNMMFDTIVQKSDVVLDEVEKLIVRNENSNELETMDIQGKFFSFTFSAIQKIFFNRDTDDSIRGKADEYQDAYDDAHRSGMAQVIHDSPALFVTTKLLPFPFGSLHPGDFTSLNPGFGFYRRFVTGHYYEFHKHRKILHRHTDEIVAQARREAGTSKDRKDLLAYFLQSNVQHTDRQLRDIILNFIIAGRDTTACTLTWFMYEMTQNPQVQDKLAEEVRKTFGKDRLPTLKDLEAENMPYMNACMLETLRLHPPVPEDQKVSLEPIEFPDGTVLPAGIKLNFSAYCMGRDPRRYPEPYKFKPERWTEGDIIARPNSEAMFEFPVFQAGNRYCIGMNLAKNETKLMMSRLLQKYSFELDPNQNPSEITFALMATMSLRNDPNPVEPKYELNVVPTRRP